MEQRKGKIVTIGIDSITGIIKGIYETADAIAITLGPAGKNVIFEIDPFMRMMPQVTKDGVTVAKEIILKDAYENMGAQIVINASQRTNSDAGDGTTTTAILVKNIVKYGLEALANNKVTVTELKRGIDEAVKYVISEIDKRSIQIKDNLDQLKSVAYISSNGDTEISDICAEASFAVGTEGVVSTKHSPDYKTFHEIVDGSIIQQGLISRVFANSSDKREFIMSDMMILVTDLDSAKYEDIMPIFDMISEICADPNYSHINGLLVFCNNIFGPAMESILATIQQNKMPLNIAICRLPGSGDYQSELAHDIATMTGGRFVSDKTGNSIRKLSLADFGRAESVRVAQYSTVIVKGGGGKDAIKKRLASVQEAIKNCNEKEIEVYQDRLKVLSGKIATIYIGAISDIESREKKDRVIDSISAVKAAMEEGVVAGGGLTFLNIARSVKLYETMSLSQKLGFDIIVSSLIEPIRKIISNADLDADKIISKLNNEKEGIGYDVQTMEYKNMIDAKIIDPAKVLKCSIKNAASVAGLILTTGAVIVTDVK